MSKHDDDEEDRKKCRGGITRDEKTRDRGGGETSDEKPPTATGTCEAQKGRETKLIVNYLPQSMTDEEFTNLFRAVGKLHKAKVMRNTRTNYSFGYGFVDYVDAQDAATAIAKLNGHKILHKTLKVAYSKPPGASKNVNLYISGLTADTTETTLDELFSPYGQLVYTRVLRNHDGSSKLVGFALFTERSEAEAAMRGLQGHADGYGMNLNIKYAKEKTQPPSPAAMFPSAAVMNPAAAGLMNMMNMMHMNDNAATTTVLFCYNIGANATEADVYGLFSRFGRITKVDLITGKGYCFVHMPIPYEANMAMSTLHGHYHNGRVLQVSIKKQKSSSS